MPLEVADAGNVPARPGRISRSEITGSRASAHCTRSGGGAAVRRCFNLLQRGMPVPLSGPPPPVILPSGWPLIRHFSPNQATSGVFTFKSSGPKTASSVGGARPATTAQWGLLRVAAWNSRPSLASALGWRPAPSPPDVSASNPVARRAGVRGSRIGKGRNTPRVWGRLARAGVYKRDRPLVRSPRRSSPRYREPSPGSPHRQAGGGLSLGAGHSSGASCHRSATSRPLISMMRPGGRAPSGRPSAQPVLALAS